MNAAVNRALDDEAMDNIDHALGRPADPLAETSRNYYATDPHCHIAKAFEASPHWKLSHVSGQMAYFNVTDDGRRALNDYLNGLLAEKRPANEPAASAFTAAVDLCAGIASTIRAEEIRKRNEAIGVKNYEGALTRARQAQTAEAIEEQIRELANIDPNGPVTGNQLREILGIEPEDAMDPDRNGQIQTCSGTWMKDSDTGLWSFDEDEAE